MAGFVLIFICIPVLIFCLLIIIGFIGNLCDEKGRAEIKSNWDKEKYCNYMFTCPMCASKRVKRIGTANRAFSVATTGLASNKIGKQYECDVCKYKW